jgi:hypothetical protein
VQHQPSSSGVRTARAVLVTRLNDQTSRTVGLAGRRYEIRHRRTEAVSDVDETVDGHGTLAAFELSNARAVKVGALTELLLGQLPIFAKPPDPPTDLDPEADGPLGHSVHGQRRYYTEMLYVIFLPLHCSSVSSGLLHPSVRKIPPVHSHTRPFGLG